MMCNTRVRLGLSLVLAINTINAGLFVLLRSFVGARGR